MSCHHFLKNTYDAVPVIAPTHCHTRLEDIKYRLEKDCIACDEDCELEETTCNLAYLDSVMLPSQQVL